MSATTDALLDHLQEIQNEQDTAELHEERFQIDYQRAKIAIALAIKQGIIEEHATEGLTPGELIDFADTIDTERNV